MCTSHVSFSCDVGADFFQHHQARGTEETTRWCEQLTSLFSSLFRLWTYSCTAINFTLQDLCCTQNRTHCVGVCLLFLLQHLYTQLTAQVQSVVGGAMLCALVSSVFVPFWFRKLEATSSATDTGPKAVPSLAYVLSDLFSETGQRSSQNDVIRATHIAPRWLKNISVPRSNFLPPVESNPK